MKESIVSPRIIIAPQQRLAAKESTIDALTAENNALRSRNGELEQESDKKDKELASLKDANSSERRKNLRNKLTIKRLEFREGYRRMEERMVRFLCAVIEGLMISQKIHFASLFKMLEEATRWHSGFDWNLLCSATMGERRADALISHGYPHIKLKPLIVALLDRDQPVTFQTLKSFDALRTQEKDAGDEEVHGSRPVPSTVSNDILPDILDKVFDGSDSNPLYQEMVQWSSKYADEYPNNSPTMMQENSAKRSVARPGTPNLQPEVNGLVDSLPTLASPSSPVASSPLRRGPLFPETPNLRTSTQEHTSGEKSGHKRLRSAGKDTPRSSQGNYKKGRRS